MGAGVSIAGMKHLCLLLCFALALFSSALWASPSADLGRVLYVGDSITHGKSSGSWRWELFKIFVDNGIRQQEVGIQSGNYNGRGGIAPGTRYRGVAFANRHAAQYSEKAAEVAGRLSEPSRMGGTGIRHWLRLEGDADSWQLAEGETPDTFFLAIGTNDFVAEHSDEPGGLAAGLKKVQAQLIGKKRGKAWNGKGDMDAIVAAMREANPRARIVVISVPTYSDAVGRWCHKAITPRDFEAVEAYNASLRQWGAAKKLSAVINMNTGFRDVTKAGAAVATMLVDQMHPDAQGNLIYAGNVARQLGYAGRTAGLARKGLASACPLVPTEYRGVSSDKANCYSFAPGGQLFIPGAEGKGATVELDFRRKGLGNGARGGWQVDSPLLVELCVEGGGCSQLQLAEDGVRWGGELLYSFDMSKLSAPVRLVWTTGSPAEGVACGFYVWGGDMLVGEALRGVATACASGVRLRAGKLPVPSLKLGYDPSGTWAPPTERFSVRFQNR